MGSKSAMIDYPAVLPPPIGTRLKERRPARGAQHDVFRRTLLTPLEPVGVQALRSIGQRYPKALRSEFPFGLKRSGSEDSLTRRLCHPENRLA